MRRRATIPAIFAVVVLVIGQLAALEHEAAARHITCEEHGEQVDAAQLVSAVDGCEQDHWIGIESGGEHEDCAIARALRQSTTTHHLALAAVTVTVATMTPVLAPEHVRRSFELYLIAPKTSPPISAA